MTHEEKRRYLIEALVREQPACRGMQIPENEQQQRRLLRSLLNVRPPRPAGSAFLRVQDDYLREETAGKGITSLAQLTPMRDGLYLWRGDITTLRADAVVNAANSKLLGCFYPCHGCIDNAIHTFAGVQLRCECARLMERQGHDEPVGQAKITSAYNLPSRYVLHTVGPYIDGPLTPQDQEKLASCYYSCLTLAEEKKLQSIAFCCISTGEFHYPNEAAAQTAVRTVQAFRKKTQSRMEVIFNVFQPRDDDIYRRLLCTDK